MIWRREKLRPTQPYFVLDTRDFSQEMYLKEGISHFYSFKTEPTREIRVVPDGCVDFFFSYGNGRMEAFVRGTSTGYDIHVGPEYEEVFGVRFMPGVQPANLNVSMRELYGRWVPLKDVLDGNLSWLSKMGEEKDFHKRMAIFLDAYQNADKKVEKPYGKGELVLNVKRMVYDSDGKIRISELGEKTGYSERYINKVFIEQMGFSPKIFCKIIQFQRALEYLNQGAPGKMTDASEELGYYDQPHFIRDFSKYSGVTPKQYMNLVKRVAL